MSNPNDTIDTTWSSASVQLMTTKSSVSDICAGAAISSNVRKTNISDVLHLAFLKQRKVKLTPTPI